MGGGGSVARDHQFANNPKRARHDQLPIYLARADAGQRRWFNPRRERGSYMDRILIRNPFPPL